MNKRIREGLLMAAAFGAALAISSCAQPLPEGTDNVPPPGSENWERIATVPNQRGVYKVVDLEDGVICYYVVSDKPRNRGPNGISCLAYYHEGSNENYRQVE